MMWGLAIDKNSDIDQQKVQLARAHRILALNGHINMTLGHISWRDPDGRGFWLKKAGLGFEEIGPADFILINLDGEVLEGTGKRHAEWPIHAEIYRNRADVAAVVHSHPIQSTIFSACDTCLRGICHESVMLHDNVAYFKKTQGLIVTTAMGEDLARTLGSKAAVLIKNHGITTCGPTISAAVLAAIFLEKACGAELAAQATGLVWSGPSTEELAPGGAARLELNPNAINDFWAYFQRQLDRHERRCEEC